MAERTRLSVAARVRWRLAPPWTRVLAIYLASRVVTTAILLVFAHVQAEANGSTVPSLAAFSANWDGQWYWLIALNGYPSELPVDADGHVAENAWAFMPVFPHLLAPLMHLGIPFPTLALLVSLASGAVASLLMYRLAREVGLDAGQALFSVVLLCTAPVSVMFQVAYAEALALALLLFALLLVIRRRFWLLLPVIVLMSFTRPAGLAFALFLLLYLVMRIVRWRRDRHAHPLPGGEFAVIVVAGLTSFAAGLAWPAIAWAVTGSPSAYLDTELAWRASYIGHGHLVPFAAWFEGLAFWARFLGVPDAASGAVGAVAVVLLVAALAVFLISPWARRLGVEVRLWIVSYAVYLLAVFFPQSSTWRLLFPLSPALAAFAVPRSRALRITLVVVGLAAQVLWIHWCWWRGPGDWSPP